ncbi:STAS domain protein [Ancylostoma ceylanicum]|uniref:STAS domain protein n=1 Tax=Ancylostoma ceylanicum TaxID=53326 RepID=A0A0D6LSE9_9BILA|nr:STAS domain protein [Ancylostoma ceylanicum]
MGRVPITKWLPSYNWITDLRADVLGGVMLSIMSLPQGLTSGAAVHVFTSQLKAMTGVDGVPPTSEPFGLIKVESGFPSPQVPSFNLVGELVWHGISIAIISFVIHIALAKLVSKKFHYEIDVNQEWFALGAMNTISSFFGCFVGGSSIGRTMTQVKFGTTSQLSTMVCCFIMVGFVYGAGAFIYHLPKMIFFVTLVSVILINVNTGLVIGIVFALLTVVFRTQWADSTCMGRIPGTSDFKGLGHYRSAEEIPGIKVFRFDAPLYFANAELFILSVHNACGLNPVLVKAKLIERAAAEKAKEAMDDSSEANKTSSRDMQLRVVGRRLADASVDSVAEDPAEHVVTQLTHIIIDCSTIPYIDLMGKDAIAQTFADYATIDITVLIANCKVAVRQLFETTDFYQKVPKNRMFVSVNDAVTQALKEQRERVPERKQIDHTGGQRHIAKDPVALSPAQKTVILNVLNEEGEEQLTQSAEFTVRKR